MKGLYKSLVVVFCVLVGIIVIGWSYSYFGGNNLNKDNKTDNKVNNVTNSTDNITYDPDKVTYGSIIEDELDDINEEYLYLLWDIESIEDISNQDKLDIALIKYKNIYNLTTIYDIGTLTKNDIELAFSNSIIKDKNIVHEDITGFFLNSRCTHNIFTYKDGNYTPQYDAHGACAVSSLKSEVVSFKETSDNKYIYSVKYAFIYSCEGATMPINIYGNYKDALNQKNSIAIITSSSSEWDDEIINNYMKDNFDSLKEKLVTYNYTFVKKNDIIKLTDFGIE